MDSPNSQSVTVAEECGLSSADKKSVEEQNEESLHVSEPEVQIIAPEKVDGQSCDVCKCPGKRQFPNGVLCNTCFYMQDYIIANKKQYKCESEGNCLTIGILSENRNRCKACWFSKITAIMSDTNGVTNHSIGQTSGENNIGSSGQCLRYYLFIYLFYVLFSQILWTVI